MSKQVRMTMSLDDAATVYAGLRTAAQSLRKEGKPGAEGPARDCDRLAEALYRSRYLGGITVDGITFTVTDEPEAGTDSFLSPVSGRA